MGARQTRQLMRVLAIETELVTRRVVETHIHTAWYKVGIPFVVDPYHLIQAMFYINLMCSLIDLTVETHDMIQHASKRHVPRVHELRVHAFRVPRLVDLSSDHQVTIKIV